jgi:hypothetical protein
MKNIAGRDDRPVRYGVPIALEKQGEKWWVSTLDW